MSKLDQHKEVFREEAYERLAELEDFLLELESKPDDTELISSIFRALHTIKGSGAMFGFDEIAKFTHEVETIFDLVRNGEMSITKELIDLTLSSRDHIYQLLENPDLINKERAGEIINSLKCLIPPDKDYTVDLPSSPALPSHKNDTVSTSNEEDMTYRIQFVPDNNMFMKGINPIHLLNDLKGLGECRIVAMTDAIPQLDHLNPEGCYTYWDIFLTTNKGINSIKEVFDFVEEDSELSIDIIDEIGSDDNDEGGKKLGEILVERGYVTSDTVQEVLDKQKRIGELLVENGIISNQDVESALAEQMHIKEVRQKQKKADPVSSIRVSSEKLDRLVDLVGELVTVQARLTRTAETDNNPDLLLISEEVERLTDELRDNTMSVRMIPIGTMFSRFKRLVRDLSQEIGKEVDMSTDGAETELDKTVIEKLNDPLVHLIRNSIDHGIEFPDDRDASGKPKKGTVHLSARHSGANVLIEIIDDGAGLDFVTIRNKAIEKGLIGPDEELSEKDAFALILSPGFSTARKVSNVSGRGVGMDVVKRNIDALRGSIEMSSKKGDGTTITLTLPLTLAIIDGLLVRIGEEVYVIPLSMVEECVERTQSDIDRAHNRNIANVRGEIVPYIILRNQFHINRGKPDIEQIVITNLGGNRVGFVVDDVIGEHQTVIKGLGSFYKDVEGVSGATILGDGTVALILDILKLVQNVEEEVSVI